MQETFPPSQRTQASLNSWISQCLPFRRLAKSFGARTGMSKSCHEPFITIHFDFVGLLGGLETYGEHAVMELTQEGFGLSRVTPNINAMARNGSANAPKVSHGCHQLLCRTPTATQLRRSPCERSAVPGQFLARFREQDPPRQHASTNREHILIQKQLPSRNDSDDNQTRTRSTTWFSRLPMAKWCCPSVTQPRNQSSRLAERETFSISAHEYSPLLVRFCE